VANSLGYRDGEDIPASQMLAAVGRIARALEVPVSADMESGYGLPAHELVVALIDAEVAGMNIEDSDHRNPGQLVDIDTHCRKLKAIKAACETTHIPLFLNARIDVHVRQVGPPETRMQEALQRARAYRDAGADGIYPIVVSEEDEIRAFVEEVDLPVNVLMRKGAPSLERLKELGVRRVTFGTGLARAALNHSRRLAAAIRAGDVSPLFEE
jgi:2-methylisocitrate lyase-like PEP mutase family enzyme